jgi:hypothetical protein
LQANTDNALCSGLDDALADRWLQDFHADRRPVLECLPAKWQGVFEARFLRQHPQREAGRELGIHPLLRRFLLSEGSTS